MLFLFNIFCVCLLFSCVVHSFGRLVGFCCIPYAISFARGVWNTRFHHLYYLIMNETVYMDSVAWLHRSHTNTCIKTSIGKREKRNTSGNCTFGLNQTKDNDRKWNEREKNAHNVIYCNTMCRENVVNGRRKKLIQGAHSNRYIQFCSSKIIK